MIALRRADVQYHQALHERKLRRAKPTIDSGAPSTLRANHPRRNRKKESIEADEWADVARANVALVDRMRRIQSGATPSTLLPQNAARGTVAPAGKTPSLNYRVRQAREVDIQAENRKIIKRLVSSKSSYAKRDVVPAHFSPHFLPKLPLADLLEAGRSVDGLSRNGDTSVSAPPRSPASHVARPPPRRAQGAGRRFLRQSDSTYREDDVSTLSSLSARQPGGLGRLQLKPVALTARPPDRDSATFDSTPRAPVHGLLPLESPVAPLARTSLRCGETYAVATCRASVGDVLEIEFYLPDSAEACTSTISYDDAAAWLALPREFLFPKAKHTKSPIKSPPKAQPATATESQREHADHLEVLLRCYDVVEVAEGVGRVLELRRSAEDVRDALADDVRIALEEDAAAAAALVADAAAAEKAAQEEKAAQDVVPAVHEELSAALYPAAASRALRPRDGASDARRHALATLSAALDAAVAAAVASTAPLNLKAPFQLGAEAAALAFLSPFASENGRLSFDDARRLAREGLGLAPVDLSDVGTYSAVALLGESGTDGISMYPTLRISVLAALLADEGALAGALEMALDEAELESVEAEWPQQPNEMFLQIVHEAEASPTVHEAAAAPAPAPSGEADAATLDGTLDGTFESARPSRPSRPAAAADGARFSHKGRRAAPPLATVARTYKSTVEIVFPKRAPGAPYAKAPQRPFRAKAKAVDDAPRASKPPQGPAPARPSSAETPRTPRKHAPTARQRRSANDVLASAGDVDTHAFDADASDASELASAAKVNDLYTAAENADAATAASAADAADAADAVQAAKPSFGFERFNVPDAADPADSELPSPRWVLKRRLCVTAAASDGEPAKRLLCTVRAHPTQKSVVVLLVSAATGESTSIRLDAAAILQYLSGPVRDAYVDAQASHGDAFTAECADALLQGVGQEKGNFILQLPSMPGV